MARVVFSKSQTKDMARLFERERMSTGKIGKIYGVSCNTIIKLLRESGVTVDLSDRRTKQFTQRQRKSIVKRYSGGLGESTVVLGEAFGCSYATIRRILKEEDAYNPDAPPRNKIQLSEKQVSEILDQYREGASANALSKKYGYSGSFILGLLRKNGFDTTDYGRGKDPIITDRGQYKTCRRLSQKIYRLHRTYINPNRYKRAYNGYHLDHKLALAEGLGIGLTIFDLAHPCNLQILKAKENLVKHKDSHISKRELIQSIKSWNKIYGDPFADINLEICYTYKYGRYRYKEK